MSKTDEENRLIASAYEAAFDPSLWPEFLRAMNRSVGASASCIFLHDFADASTGQDAADASLGVLEGFDPVAWEAYMSHYSRVNVWTQKEESLPSGIAVTSSMLYSDEMLPKTEFGADWLRPQDLFYALGGIVDRQGTVALKMSFVRPRRRGGFEGQVLSLWQSMMPHVQRAADLHRRLAGSEQRARDAEAALSLLPSGVILVGSNGRVRSVNPAGTVLLSQRRGLLIDRDGRLVAAPGTANQVLQREIFLATHPASVPGFNARFDRTLRLRGEGGPLHLGVASLPVQSQRLSVAASAVVFLNDPTVKPTDLTPALMTQYRMTRAEALLTSALVGGSSLREYAERAKVTLNTVRTQLRGASAKAGAKRQVDLVRIVLSGPAVNRHVPEP
jgi:DNA-binding CsgD family transcriptional regulator